MEKTISASEANQRFSEMLRDVARGDSFTVMSRGRAVARISPPANPQEEQRGIEELLAYLRSLPVRDAGPWKREDLYE